MTGYTWPMLSKLQRRTASLRLTDHRATAAWSGAAALAFGVLLLPGHTAAAKPAHPTAAAAVAGRPATTQAVAVTGSLTTAAAPAVVPAVAPAAPAAAPAWSAPAPGASITEQFGVPNHEYAAGYHTGVDFAVNSGTPLLAVADATVVSAGWDGAYGQDVVLHLPDGRFALYAHMSKLGVHAGQTVRHGQPVGLSGNTGHTTGPHLHFEIRTANQYGKVTDPVAYLTTHGATNL